MTSVTKVRPAHAFDEAALSAYLRANLIGFLGPVIVQQFSFGQSNPTFLISDAASGASWVLRKKPPGTAGKGAHAIEREFKVMQ